MPPIGSEEFSDALPARDPEGLVRFVAALYRARGRRPFGDPDPLARGERTRELAVVLPDGPTPSRTRVPPKRPNRSIPRKRTGQPPSSGPDSSTGSLENGLDPHERE